MTLGIPEILVLAALAVLFGVPLALLLWFAAHSIQMRALRRHVAELQSRMERLERAEPQGPMPSAAPPAARPTSGSPVPEADRTPAGAGPAEPEPSDRLLEPLEAPDGPDDDGMGDRGTHDHGTDDRPMDPGAPSGHRMDEDESAAPVDDAETDRRTGGSTR